jgi:PIN domain nuclease of toxin-antitoxin system
MMYVMDASALLALMQGERGGDVVNDLIVEHECVASSVNIVEVGTRLVDKGLAPAHLARTLKELDVQTIDFDLEQALLSASLRMTTRQAGLSLGDRACLALAQLMNGTAVTSDSAWQDVADAAGVKVLMIR